jgi:hypothetical protein
MRMKEGEEEDVEGEEEKSIRKENGRGVEVRPCTKTQKQAAL